MVGRVGRVGREKIKIHDSSVPGLTHNILALSHQRQRTLAIAIFTFLPLLQWDVFKGKKRVSVRAIWDCEMGNSEEKKKANKSKI